MNIQKKQINEQTMSTEDFIISVYCLVEGIYKKNYC